ncbi:MAG: hypothetical protein KGO93_07770 [Cyanobacteria bacterium REEB446]|nr:hypothetical protein [Cyanobacteria bacterium REEB446]
MNINFFPIQNFDKAEINSKKTEKTLLPGSVWDKLTTPEGDRLLEIIEKFEKNPTDLKAKEKDYDELMKLFYKGIGLDKNGSGTISKEDQRAALELSALINDAILNDQQNISKIYNPNELKKALDLQNKFRKDLETKPGFKKLLNLVEESDSYNELSEGQKEYQTEKITSYLAENKQGFQKIFKTLSKNKPDELTLEQQEQLKNLKTLAGEKGQSILNKILSTFDEFKAYEFLDPQLSKMDEDPNRGLVSQAKASSTYDNWERRGVDDAKLAEKEDDRPTRTSRRESSETDRILKEILARLEKLEKRCAEKDTDAEKDTEKQASTTPDWLGAITAGLGIAGKFLNITGLGNNQNACCYPPVPCYGSESLNCPSVSYSGRGSAYCPPRPYYVGGDTWPWGRANGINAEYSAFNNYMPSSGSYSATSNPSSTSSSNPYSSSSAYNPINIELNPVFNNNPIQSSASYSGARSSNAAEIRRSFGINMPGICRT